VKHESVANIGPTVSIQRGGIVVAKIAAWYWNSCLFEGCKGVTAKPAA
jgi:hypothetical protein